MVNYLPNKFSNGVLLESFYAGRQRNHNGSMSSLPPNGNSWDSLGLGEPRPASEYSLGEDKDCDFRDDSSTHAWLSNRVTKYQKLRWNKFKWILFIANVLVGTTQITRPSKWLTRVV